MKEDIFFLPYPVDNYLKNTRENRMNVLIGGGLHCFCYTQCATHHFNRTCEIVYLDRTN